MAVAGIKATLPTSFAARDHKLNLSVDTQRVLTIVSFDCRNGEGYSFGTIQHYSLVFNLGEAGPGFAVGRQETGVTTTFNVHHDLGG